MSRHKQSCDDHVRFRAGCDPCRRMARNYEKRRLLLLAQGQRQSVAAGLTTQRLQELRALGYTVDTLAAETGLGWATVKRLSHGGAGYVFLRVFLAVEAAYARLSPFPGTSPRAVLWAEKHGWEPPAVDEPVPLVLVDQVKIDRVLYGDRTVQLTRDELTEAWRTLTARGMSEKNIAKTLRVSQRTIARWKQQVPTSRRLA